MKYPAEKIRYQGRHWKFVLRLVDGWKGVLCGTLLSLLFMTVATSQTFMDRGNKTSIAHRFQQNPIISKELPHAELKANPPSAVWKLNSLESIGGYRVTTVGNPQIKKVHGDSILEFDGTDDGIIVQGCPIENANAFTVEILMRPDSAFPANKEQRFLHFQKPGLSSRRGLIELRLNDKHQWFIDTHIRADSNALTCLAKDFPHPVGEWYHVAFVYENGVASHYVNGKEEMSGRIAYIPVDSAVVALGMRMNQVSYFKGAIHSVSFSRKRLKPHEFQLTPFFSRITHSSLNSVFQDDAIKDPAHWIAEFEKPATSSFTWNNGLLDISASAGATVWFKERLKGNLMISYDVVVIDSNGINDRVSDLNAFWMANDPAAATVFGRNGKFSSYDNLDLYYSGIGGHDNSTSRFRRYHRSGEKPVLFEYTDIDHLLKGNRNYRITIIIRDGRTSYFRDNELFFDYSDPQPLTNGFFGFRLTRSHQRIQNIKFYQIAEMKENEGDSPEKSFLYVSLKEEQGIALYTFDSQNGTIEFIKKIQVPGQPGSLATDPGQTILYAALRTTNSVAAFSIDQQSGDLNLIKTTPVAGNPVYIQADNSGNYIFTAYFGDNRIAVYRRESDGGIDSSAVQIIATPQHPHSIQSNPKRNQVYVPCRTSNTILQFEYAPDTGTLTQNRQSIYSTPEGLIFT